MGQGVEGMVGDGGEGTDQMVFRQREAYEGLESEQRG